MRKHCLPLDSEVFTLWEDGDISQPALVYLHGLPGSWRDLRSDSRDLLKSRFRIIVFDRRGYGDNQNLSSIPDLRVQSKFYEKALNALGISSFFVAAHSWASGLSFFMSSGNLGRVLLAPLAFARPNEKDPSRMLAFTRHPFLFRLLAHSLGRKGIASAWKRNFAPLPVDRQCPAPAISANLLKNILLDQLALFNSFSLLRKLYSESHVPTLILAGKEDRVSDLKSQAEHLNEILSQSSLLLLEGVGHSLPQSCPDWASTFVDFLFKEKPHVAKS